MAGFRKAVVKKEINRSANTCIFKVESSELVIRRRGRIKRCFPSF